jgi:DUF1680 family protein
MAPGRVRPAVGVLVVAALAGPAGAAGAEPAPDLPVRSVVPLRAVPFALADVRLLDGPFREAQLRNRDYLLSLDTARLLHTFRLSAGLPSAAQPLGGWEAPDVELRGHSLGHFLSASALTYAATGDAAVRARGEAVVEELARCQEASPRRGYRAGYLSAFPESFIDRVVARERVWAPWYTLHKIMAGLLDMHVLCGDRLALDVLARMAGWTRSRIDALAPEQRQRMLDTEFGGMGEVLANLYAVTGDPEHLRLARAFDHEAVFDPLARGEDRLDGLHANTQIPKMIAAAREYELTGEDRYRAIARFFWERVALHRSYVIGGHSDGEHFFPIAEFPHRLTPETAETCNTYNMLKLTRSLFGWEPSAAAMDFYERGLFNHILASQDPDRGMFVYLMSLKPGHFKTYSTPCDSFWCCVGTGMENHAKYGDTIYFHGADSLYVNLFIASQVEWREKGVTVRQETRFPESDTTGLTVRSRVQEAWTLRIRWPSWAERGFEVRLNGHPMKVTGEPGSYVAVARTWTDGDRVDVRMPMSLRTEALPGAPDTVAILYGPIVLAGALGRDGLAGLSEYAKDQTDLLFVPDPEVPVFVSDDSNVLDRVRPVEGKPLTFETHGLGRPRDVTLIPFYRLHHQRYTVYWERLTPAGFERQRADAVAADNRRLARERRTIDRVRPGDAASEQEHDLAGEHTSAGGVPGGAWREASPGGWFAWRMKMATGPTVLSCRFWGSDFRNRTFDILVDGERVATQRLENERPGEFLEVDYPIPEVLTRGKAAAVVRFQPREGQTAGGIFGCSTLQAE